MDKKLTKLIRSSVLKGEGSDIRGLLLNKNQIDLLNFIRPRGTMRASLLAAVTGLSIQNTSSKLNRLYVAGYLDRTETSSTSGGIEYFYNVAN